MTFSFVQPNRNKAVVLNRVVDDPDQERHAHGKTRCVACDAWCWLGAMTFALVAAGGAQPICTHCAQTFTIAAPVNMLKATRKETQQ